MPTRRSSRPARRSGPETRQRPRAAAKRRQSKPAAQSEATDELVLLAEPLTECPEPPDRLGSHGRQCWVRIVPLLVELRLLTALHLEALEALCHQWDDYLTWQIAIRKKPALAIVEFESGARQKSPEATLRDSAYDRWLKLLPRFGLSPEHLRKLKRLKEPTAGGGRGSRARDDVDPVAAFARQKYPDE